MSQTDDASQKLDAAMRQVREEEADKRMLYDKSIGGPMVPRPSDEFIRQNVGELRNEKQIEQEAARRVARDERNARDGGDMIRGRPHSNREALRDRQPGENRDTGSMRDKLRDQGDDRSIGRSDDPTRRGGISR